MGSISDFDFHPSILFFKRKKEIIHRLMLM